jgi:hypothetical protein
VTHLEQGWGCGSGPKSVTELVPWSLPCRCGQCDGRHSPGCRRSPVCSHMTRHSRRSCSIPRLRSCRSCADSVCHMGAVWGTPLGRGWAWQWERGSEEGKGKELGEG